MAGEFSARFSNVAAEERYDQIVIRKNIWEEQGFKYDDGLDNYGLETIIHKRNNTIVNVRGRMVSTDTDTINEILDLPEGQPSIYDHMKALEDIDYNSIKDVLCQPGTEWNIIDKNPGTISRPNLLPEAKLWNTIVK
ncbi:hypothetical protein V6N11_076783 [Hibiscus sabdariffa]|uniref:Uncharacterized protein n=1 Tax=Hibiscus sabdariffa TaxID=183260 RepID=A0ABR2P9J6_9ROSI